MISGSIVALVTPMLADGSLDEAALKTLVDFHCGNGTDAIVSVGTTGESATAGFEEHGYIIRKTLEFVDGRLPVIAGAGANSTSEAIRLTQDAKYLGADACLLVTPYYNKPPQEGLYQHYKKIAETVDIPLILYNVPGRTAVDLLPETVERLSKISNIIGIKEATGDLKRAKDIMDRCRKDFILYSGDDATALECMLLGAKGDISVTANIAPKAMHEMSVAAIGGDKATAEKINKPLEGLHKHLFSEANPIPVKWALLQMGLIKEGIRLPLVPLNKIHHDVVRQAMKQAGILK